MLPPRLLAAPVCVNVCVCPDTRTLKTMLEGDSSLRSRVVRFLMECDEAVAMRKDGHLNPLFAHSSVSYRSTDGPRGLQADRLILLPYRPIGHPTDRPGTLATDGPVALPTDRFLFLRYQPIIAQIDLPIDHFSRGPIHYLTLLYLLPYRPTDHFCPRLDTLPSPAD